MRTMPFVAVCLSVGVLPAAVHAQADPEIEALKRRVEKLEEDNKRLMNTVAELQAKLEANLAMWENKEPKPPVFRSPYWRKWHFEDGSRLDAELIDFASGEAVLRDDAGEDHRVRTKELSPADRNFVQDTVKARTEIERALKEGSVVKCPNKKCRRGLLYDFVEDNRLTPVPGGFIVENLVGRRPIGMCETCGGRGVVPNPKRE